MFWFKFDQNLTKNEEFDFFEGRKIGLWIGTLLPSGGPSSLKSPLYRGGPFFPPRPSKKSNSSFLVRFWLNLNRTIFICLAFINKITIWKWRLPFFLPSYRIFEKVKFLIFGYFFIKFESKHFHMLTINK